MPRIFAAAVAAVASAALGPSAPPPSLIAFTPREPSMTSGARFVIEDYTFDADQVIAAITIEKQRSVGWGDAVLRVYRADPVTLDISHLVRESHAYAPIDWITWGWPGSGMVPLEVQRLTFGVANLRVAAGERIYVELAQGKTGSGISWRSTPHAPIGVITDPAFYFFNAAGVFGGCPGENHRVIEFHAPTTDSQN